MPDEHAFSNITLNGDFSADGEYFRVTLDLNGVPIRFGNIYVGDQREAFTDAKNASPTKPEEPAPAQG